ncbi:hypothetical protein RDI58_001612 [Solanum bulbocastanum]|uniref:Uncharacterized protein n=1 Tax=Solanum bulbocastanum TaxID=147425 RepID=A0AAN8U8B3_SOLBU
MDLSTSASFSSSSSSSWFSGIVRGRSSSVKMANKNPAAAAAGGADSVSGAGPITAKKQFRGVMFKYGPKAIQVAFKTGDYKQQVIFIGGLTDGFLATDYLEPLAIALDKEKWSLVQFLVSSSYSGYGTSSLRQEDSEGVVLLGHSTGCQDIVYYMRTNAACSRAVRAAILQAPVSDREYKATLPDTASMIDLASNMISEGRESELMPREANPDAPITSFRYHSLCAYNGEDDLFSSDFSDDQLKQKLGHMSNTPCQVGDQVHSSSESYFVLLVSTLFFPWVMSTFQIMLTRKHWLIGKLCKAMGGAEKVEIEYGNHSLSNRVVEAVEAIMSFVKREGPSGWDDPWN